MLIYEIDKFPALRVGNKGDNTERDYQLVLAPELKNDDRISIIYVTIPPGGRSDYHKHDQADEFMYYLGDATAVIEGRSCSIKKNSLVIMHKGERHQNINADPEKPLNIFCMFLQAGQSYKIPDELIRITAEYLSQNNE